MVIFHELTTPIEVDTPMGRGWAVFIRDYGFHYDDLWTVLISSTMQFWTFRNKHIRGVKNYTFGVGVKETHVETDQQGA